MPTYRITAPDGAQYDVTPPEGTNPTEAEVLAQVQAQAGASSPAPKGLYQRIAEPVTSVVAKGIGLADTAMRGGLPFAAATPDDANAIAGMVVPQTPIEAGAMIGTGGAGLLARGAGRGLQALARVTGGLVGGEAAGQASGEPTGKGAAIGGGGAAVGEGVAAAGSKLMRSLPWMKGVIARGDERAFANAVGDVSEPLAGMNVRAMGSGGGRRALRTDREARISAIEAAIGNQPISVPSLGGPMPLRDALDALSNVGVRLGQHPADRSVRQAPDALDYRTIIGEIRTGLDSVDPTGRASAAFGQAQDVYRGGKTLIRQILAQEGLFNADGQFNSAAAQKLLTNPRRAELLRERLGDDQYEALVNVAFRGGNPADGRDRLAQGAGGLMDPLKTWARGGNTGFWGLPMALGRTLLPNIGSQYAGRAPFTAPAPLNAILDAAGQRAVSAGDRR